MTAALAPTPGAMYDAYRQCCAEQAALPPEQWTFKSDPRYTTILEHVTLEQAEDYWSVIEETVPNLLPALRVLLPNVVGINDTFGEAQKTSLLWLGVCSPVNLRYLCHAVLIWRHCVQIGGEGMDAHFIEIGGGYGGLAFYLHWLAGLTNRRLRSYTILDVPEVVQLQRAYCEALRMPVYPINGLSAFNLSWLCQETDGAPRYCISAYAFSEFDEPMREWYWERVIRHCAHGFVVWNGESSNAFAGPVYPFVDTSRMQIVPERPQTGKNNVVVTW